MIPAETIPALEDGESGGQRRLGFWSATALVVGHTIGVGIFLTPAQVIGAVGSPAGTLFLWAAGGALVLAGAFTFGELASRYPRAGGLYVYLHEGFGDRAAFLYGWLCLLVMDPGVGAALAAGLAPYLALLVPAAAGHERLAAVALVWALALVNMAGLRLGSRFLNALTALKVLFVVGFALAALCGGSGSWSHFVPFAARRAGSPPAGEALALGVIGVFYSFGGFWEASRVAGEIRDPRRVLPRALTAGVALVTGIYVLTTVAFLYLVPPREAATAEGFARRAGEELFGAGGPAALAFLVVLSAGASAMALLLMAPRLYVAMSRDGLFPSTLGALHPRTGSPARATAFLASMATLFLLAGGFSQIVALFLCPTLLFVAFAAAALFAARRDRSAPVPPFRAPGFPATPVIFIAFLIAIVGLVAVARPVPALAGFGLVALGLPAYAIASKRRRAPGGEGGPR